MNFAELNEQMPLPNEAAARAAQAHWDGIAKPLHSLGQLEEDIVKIAALTGEPEVQLQKRGVLVVCADNGVVQEGVTQTDASVTATMAGQIAQKKSCVCRMAAQAGAEVMAVDVGMLKRVPGVLDRHVADGTGNIAQEPAMSRQQAIQAIQVGIDLVKNCRREGFQILVTGEMGIGNTTTSSAVTAVLLGMAAEQVTGRGAGLSDAGLRRKVAAIRRAIAVNQPDPQDPLDVLSKVGGFDIAAMAGIFLGGALYQVPILIDGLISSVSALIAARLCPRAKGAMLASHCSAEPAALGILQELGLNAMLQAGLHLGEGTGAVCMLPMYDLALAVYHNSAAFSEAGVEQYREQGGQCQ